MCCINSKEGLSLFNCDHRFPAAVCVNWVLTIMASDYSLINKWEIMEELNANSLHVHKLNLWLRK